MTTTSLYFAEGERSPRPRWFRVMKHEGQTLFLPDVVSHRGKIQRVTRDICRYPCAFDRIEVDFLPSWEAAERLAATYNQKGAPTSASDRRNDLLVVR